MKTGLGVWITVGMVVFACGSKDHSKSADEISGAYVRQYSFKVVNQETGVEIGMRTIRDTIFIQVGKEKYDVSNHKWKLNQYDDQGWQNMKHDDDRPMSDFAMRYDQEANILISTNDQLGATVFKISVDHKYLVKGKESSIQYERVK